MSVTALLVRWLFLPLTLAQTLLLPPQCRDLSQVHFDQQATYPAAMLNSPELAYCLYNSGTVYGLVGIYGEPNSLTLRDLIDQGTSLVYTVALLVSTAISVM